MAPKQPTPKPSAAKSTAKLTTKRKLVLHKEVAAPTQGEPNLPMEKKVKLESSKFHYFPPDRMLPGLSIDFGWCREVGFVELLESIESQGWTYLFEVCSKACMYPEAMGEFCSNFSNKGGVCQSEVNGKSFSFDAEKLGNWFKVPVLGEEVYHKGKGPIELGGATMEDVYSYFGGQGKHPKALNQSLLTPFQKVLFNVVRRGLVPRHDKRALASRLDLIYIFLLESQCQINFSMALLLT